jgi:transcription elongation factor
MVPDGEDDGDFPSTIVTINLIPRIPLEKKRKRKTHMVPEAAVLFDSHRYKSECKRIEQDEDGKQQENMWRFRRSTFRNGLLEIKVVMSSLNFKKVNPTREELGKWLECRDEDVVLAAKNVLVLSHSEKRASGLWPGDRVEVKQGWAQGRKGTVQSVKGDEVLLDDMTSPSSPPVTIRIMDIQKYFAIGDHVCMISGPEVGLDGWCIKVEDGAVQVLEHGTHREVSSLYFMSRSMPKVSPFLAAGCTRPTSDAAVCALDLEATRVSP